MTEQIMRADPVWRRRFLGGVCVFTVVGGAVVWLASARLRQLDGLGPAEVRRLLWLVVGLASLTTAGVGVYLFRYAARVLRSGQCPPPGARVLRDTPVRTGDAARRLGWLVTITAALLSGAAVAPPLLLYRLLRALSRVA